MEQPRYWHDASETTIMSGAVGAAIVHKVVVTDHRLLNFVLSKGPHPQSEPTA